MLGLRLIEWQLCKSFYCPYSILYLYINYSISFLSIQVLEALVYSLYCILYYVVLCVKFIFKGS